MSTSPLAVSDQLLTEKTKVFSVKSDWGHWAVLYGVSGFFALICVVFLLSVVVSSLPAWRHSGLSIIYGTTWSQGTDSFGALPIIAGTLATTAIALVFAIPIGIGSALAIVHVLPGEAQGLRLLARRAPGGGTERRLRALGPFGAGPLVRKDRAAETRRHIGQPLSFQPSFRGGPVAACRLRAFHHDPADDRCPLPRRHRGGARTTSSRAPSAWARRSGRYCARWCCRPPRPALSAP